MHKKLWIPAIVLAILLSQFGVAVAVNGWLAEAGPPGPAGAIGSAGPQGSAAEASSCQAEMYDRLIKEKSSEVARTLAASACGEGRLRR